MVFHGREVWLIQVLSPDEMTPAMSGKINMLDTEAQDPEDGRHYRTEVSRTSVKAYEEALRWLQQDMLNFCAAREIGFIQIRTDESIEKMLFQHATEAGMIL